MSAIVFITCSVIPIYIIARANRIFRAHRVKIFLAIFSGIWTSLYAGLVPAGTFFLGIQNASLRGYFEASAILLLLSYLIFLVLLMKVKLRDASISFLPYKNVFLPLTAFAVFAMLFPNFFLSPYLRSLVVLPGATLLYTISNNSQNKIVSVLFHAFSILVALQAGIITDSKEALVVFTIGPLLLSYVFRNRGISLKDVPIVLLVAVAGILLFIIAQPIVTLNRAGQHIDLHQVIFSIPENFETIATTALNRVFVLDALARTLRNEFLSIPHRPSFPLWTLTGWIFAVMPAFFSRPIHAREALDMTGYITSTSEVNIAVTYVGNLIWSYSIYGFFPAILLFWFLFLALVKVGCRLGPTSSTFFLFSSAFTMLRLERLADVFLGTVFMALTLNVVLFLIREFIAPSGRR